MSLKPMLLMLCPGERGCNIVAARVFWLVRMGTSSGARLVLGDGYKPTRANWPSASVTSDTIAAVTSIRLREDKNAWRSAKIRGVERIRKQFPNQHRD